MEAINSLASVATKAIWGDNTTTTNTTANKDTVPKASSEEPISGVQGDTSKGEPFDAGNIEPKTPTVDTTADAATTDTTDTITGTTTDPSLTLPSSHTKGDSTQHQMDAREPGDHAHPEADQKKTDVDNTEPLDPESLKGPGPKPLEQVARENGGDAAAATSAVTNETKPGVDGKENKPDDVGQGGPNRASADEGMGTKYVASSGLAADGGDFDAANPGAGREAERLLEEKGIHHETPKKKSASPAPATGKDASPSSGKSSSPERKGGVRGLGKKIKDKLRRSSQA